MYIKKGGKNMVMKQKKELESITSKLIIKVSTDA
jgi:hypothetical protein